MPYRFNRKGNSNGMPPMVGACILIGLLNLLILSSVIGAGKAVPEFIGVCCLWVSLTIHAICMGVVVKHFIPNLLEKNTTNTESTHHKQVLYNDPESSRDLKIHTSHHHSDE